MAFINPSRVYVNSRAPLICIEPIFIRLRVRVLAIAQLRPIVVWEGKEEEEEETRSTRNFTLNTVIAASR